MKAFLIALALGCTQAVFAQDLPSKPLTPTQYQEVAKTQKGILVDVRTPEEFAQGHLKKARNLDYRGGVFAQQLESLDKSKTYYLYCASGNRSGKALQLMKEAGFEHVYNIGGFTALQAAGLPTKTPKAQPKQ
ncbi:rhodanese-like domain-containing protein [Rufibacter psychrotolerans]|uniref:rhodanese-like domain-containing protein n=1 Tax=Rufibacter psychrotolerans TaxID=2812556 RepID=UPI0019680F55|nr:rhodanese-like domain-containing protein [Rufibacter sp. SYSU D00308]